jgi:hypothetical protein
MFLCEQMDSKLTKTSRDSSGPRIACFHSHADSKRAPTLSEPVGESNHQGAQSGFAQIGRVRSTTVAAPQAGGAFQSKWTRKTRPWNVSTPATVVASRPPGFDDRVTEGSNEAAHPEDGPRFQCHAVIKIGCSRVNDSDEKRATLRTLPNHPPFSKPDWHDYDDHPDRYGARDCDDHADYIKQTKETRQARHVDRGTALNRQCSASRWSNRVDSSTRFSPATRYRSQWRGDPKESPATTLSAMAAVSKAPPLEDSSGGGDRAPAGAPRYATVDSTTADSAAAGRFERPLPRFQP